MTSSWAVEVRRSTADWASSGSLMMASLVGREHGGGLVVAGDDEFVGGRGGVHGLQASMTQQLDFSQSPHLRFVLLSSRDPLSCLNIELLRRNISVGTRRRTADPEGGRHVGLADPHGTQPRSPCAVRQEEPQAGQVSPQGAVIAHRPRSRPRSPGGIVRVQAGGTATKS